MLIKESITNINKLQTEDINYKYEKSSYDNNLAVSADKYFPEDLKLEIYLDYDNAFIVLEPVFQIDNNKFYLSDSEGLIEKSLFDLQFFMQILCSYLNQFNIRKSKYFPDYLILSAIYVDDILNFLLEVIPYLMGIASIYYTDNFKKVMIRRNTLSVSVSCPASSIDEYLEINFEYDSFISAEELEEIMNLKEDEIRFYHLRSGGFIDLRAEKVVETLNFLKKFGITRRELEQRKLSVLKSEVFYTADFIGQAAKNKIIDYSGLDLNNIEKRVFNISEKKLSLPRNLKTELRPYQEEGFRWLKMLYCAGLGGILADDMGLGKTVQTICLILSVFAENPDVKSVIVVPTSLIDNWISELNRFAPNIKCRAVIGEIENRKQIFKQWDDYNVFVTSYGLAVNDIEVYRNKMIDILVLDEAQKIKNYKTKTAREIKKIRARSKFALTGTPIENNISELWSIFNWLLPSLLKDFKSFKARYMSSSDNYQELRKKISPFILRRMKKSVLQDLPRKTETVIKVDLTKRQKKLYLSYREEALQLLEENKIFNVLSKLTRLRQICCHPGMFLDNYRELTAKMEVLLDIIDELQTEKRKVLVFSQFTTMLDLIKEELKKNNIEYTSLDGRTAQKDRSKIVDNFNNNTKTALLISLKAGGTGLNLTSADTVIHCDPWWNPSVEEQASARAYRIGQENKVQIIYLIASGTIEEKISNVKQSKKELIEKLIKPGKKAIASLSREELKSLLH